MRFSKGQTPWNAGTAGKGVMRPNRTSFSKGHGLDSQLPIGSVSIRTDKHGVSRAWVKIGDAIGGGNKNWKYRAVIVWESVHGKVPRGSLVHHKDRNTLNDDIGNLELMTRARHMAEHRRDLEAKGRAANSSATKARHAANRAKKQLHTGVAK